MVKSPGVGSAHVYPYVPMQTLVGRNCPCSHQRSDWRKSNNLYSCDENKDALDGQSDKYRNCLRDKAPRAQSFKVKAFAAHCKDLSVNRNIIPNVAIDLLISKYLYVASDSFAFWGCGTSGTIDCGPRVVSLHAAWVGPRLISQRRFSAFITDREIQLRKGVIFINI